MVQDRCTQHHLVVLVLPGDQAADDSSLHQGTASRKRPPEQRARQVVVRHGVRFRHGRKLLVFTGELLAPVPPRPTHAPTCLSYVCRAVLFHRMNTVISRIHHLTSLFSGLLCPHTPDIQAKQRYACQYPPCTAFAGTDPAEFIDVYPTPSAPPPPPFPYLQPPLPHANVRPLFFWMTPCRLLIQDCLRSPGTRVLFSIRARQFRS